MQIAILIADRPDAVTEGGVHAPLQLATAMSSIDGVEVDVYKSASKVDEALRDEYGLDFVSMRPKLGAKAVADRLSPLPSKYNTPLIGCSIPATLRERRYDVLNVNNAVLLRSFYQLVKQGQTTRTPVVITGHGIDELFNQPELLGMNTFERLLYQGSILPAYKRSLRRADGVITLSGEAKATVKRVVSGLKAVYVASNGVPAAVRVGTPDPTVLDKYDLTPPVVLYVGGFQRTKGIDDAIALSHALDSGTLAIVGADKDGIRDWATTRVNNDVARLLGYVSTEDLRQLYALADILFYPTRSDNFPLVVLEAMTNGTPVVATDVGAIRREVGAGGVVVDQREELVQTTLSLLEDDGRRAELGAIARARVDDHFTWDAVACEYLSIFEDVVNNGGNR